MKIDVFNQQNNKIGEMELSDKIFAAKWNPELVHQALIAQLANRRTPIAHTKGRGEVSGGGRKPWRQKGTGRARHGSIRSPLWIGGGVAFGPTKERNFSKKINKKAKLAAISGVFSKRIKDGNLKIIDSLKQKDESLKTKNMNKTLKVFLPELNALLIPSSENKSVKKAVSNIKNIGAISPKSLNIYDLLRYKNVVLEKEAVGEIEKHYFNK